MFHKLGQHFLKNQNAVKKIIASLDLEKGDTIIEIGPGGGALTFPLLENCEKIGCQLIAIEKDVSLAQKLKEQNAKLKIIEGDALRELSPTVDNLGKTHFKVVGNIPYYITGKLLRTLGDLKNRPKITVLMVQKEVAERISAKPPRMNPVRGREGSQRAPASNGMNLLAAAVQFWADPKVLFRLKPEDFSPPPEVDSAVIKLESRKWKVENRIEENYYKFIKIAFKQPRKTLLNNLSAELMDKEQALKLLKSLSFNEKTRPQELSVKNILELSKKL